MSASLHQILSSYNDKAELADALTIPGPWYVDPRIADLESKTVFSNSWQMVGRVIAESSGRRKADTEAQFVTFAQSLESQ